LQNGVEGKTERLSLTKQVHEFVHVAQYERLGREGFFREYIQQIAAHGYPNAPFEQEAEAKVTKACPGCRNLSFLNPPMVFVKLPKSVLAIFHLL
jgi:hypothetical protein